MQEEEELPRAVSTSLSNFLQRELLEAARLLKRARKSLEARSQRTEEKKQEKELRDDAQLPGADRSLGRPLGVALSLLQPQHPLFSCSFSVSLSLSPLSHSRRGLLRRPGGEMNLGNNPAARAVLFVAFPAKR